MTPSGTTASSAAVCDAGRPPPATLVHLSQGDSYTLEVDAEMVNGVRQVTITLLPVPIVRSPVSCGSTFAQIASLPTSTVPRKGKRAMTETGQDSAEAAEATSCTICMDDYKGGEKLCTLPCSHVYHLKVNRKRGQAAVPQGHMPLVFSTLTSRLTRALLHLHFPFSYSAAKNGC